MNARDEISTYISRIEYHQTEINKLTAKLIKVIDPILKNLPIPGTTDRDKIMAVLEKSGPDCPLTSQQIQKQLKDQGMVIKQVPQKLCGMEKAGIISCIRYIRFKKYYINHIQK